MCNYETHQHMHIGYYEDGYDLEVTAYKKNKQTYLGCIY